MVSGLRKEDRIFVAGHNGLVGSALYDELLCRGYKDLLKRSRSELNLLNQSDVYAFYGEMRPDVVFIAAAKVGGIHANNQFRADFISENLQIQSNLIIGAHKFNVRRLVFLGSSCIYPRDCHQPMREVDLLSGPLETTNQPYAIAKIAGLELVNAFRQQHGYDWFSVMPTNLYGPRDNFHPENSHVVPALIRRFYEAKQAGLRSVKVWGSGKPKRELMLSIDCAKAIINLAEIDDLEPAFKESFAQRLSHINVGSGQEFSIAEIAQGISEAVGFEGEIEFDSSKPDGAPRKLLDLSVVNKLITLNNTDFQNGLRMTLDYFSSTIGRYGSR
jgi:GDP-L-fucose synthase